MTKKDGAGARTGGVLVRLLGQSGIYALGNAAVKAGGLVLAVFYLDPDYLTVEAFGYLSLLQVTADLAIYTVGLGIGRGMLKYLTDPALREHHAALPFTALIATALAALAAAAVLALAARPLAGYLLDDAAHSPLLLLLAVYVALKVIGQIPLMLARVQERVGLFAAATAAETVALVGGVYLFLVVLGRGLEGILLGQVAAAGASALVLVAGMLARVRWRFHRASVGPLVRFGAPLVIASVAGRFLNAGDRLLLDLYVPVEVIAQYEWAARIAGVLNLLLVQSFQAAFAVLGLKALGDNESATGGDASLHRRTFRHFMAAAGLATLALSLFAHDLTALLVTSAGASPAYLDAVPLVLPLALGFMAYGAYFVIANVLLAAARTRSIGAAMLMAALVNVVLNLAFIPLLGAWGAAVATFLAYLALALITERRAARSHRVRYAWGTFFLVVALVTALWALALPTFGWSAATGLLGRIAVVLAYPLLLVLLGVYRREELRRLRAEVMQRIRR